MGKIVAFEKQKAIVVLEYLRYGGDIFKYSVTIMLYNSIIIDENKKNKNSVQDTKIYYIVKYECSVESFTEIIFSTGCIITRGIYYHAFNMPKNVI